jgi:hypothetical protein
MKFGLLLLGPILLLGGCDDARLEPGGIEPAVAGEDRDLVLFAVPRQIPGYAEMQTVLQALASTRAPEDHSVKLTLSLRDVDGPSRDVAFSTCALGAAPGQRFHSVSPVLPPGTKAAALVRAAFQHPDGEFIVDRELELRGK